jgi:predicted nucleic acid-binding protein
MKDRAFVDTNYDCLIMVSALLNECNLLLSEDMQNGQIIEGILTVINPFLGK